MRNNGTIDAILNKYNIDNLHQLPEDAGQIVDYRYGVDWEPETLVMVTTDRSDMSVTVEIADIESGEFEPWNGILPEHGEWTVVR